MIRSYHVAFWFILLILSSCTLTDERIEIEISDFKMKYDNGIVMYEGQKKGDERIGTWNWYYPDGELFKRRIYENDEPGKLIQAQEYYSNSKLKEDVRLLPMSSYDYRSYLKTEYHIDGTKDSETQYEVRVFYDDEGYEYKRTQGVKTKFDSKGTILYKVHDSDQSKKYREWFDADGKVIGKQYEDDV